MLRGMTISTRRSMKHALRYAPFVHLLTISTEIRRRCFAADTLQVRRRASPGLGREESELVRCAWIVIMVLVSSCASTPQHFYTLVREPDPTPFGAGATEVQLTVDPVKIPAQVDRLEIVSRLPDGGIAIADGERWIAPLADELRSALSIELVRGLSGRDSGQPGRSSSVSVRLDVQRFESSVNRYALIEASWHLELKEAGSDVSVVCRTRTYQEVSSGYAELVRGYQRAIAVIAGEIATVVQDSIGGEVAHCRRG